MVAVIDGPMPQTKEHVLLARQVGVPSIVVALNKSDMVDDAELLDWSSSRFASCCRRYQFPADDLPVSRSPRSGAPEGDRSGRRSGCS